VPIQTPGNYPEENIQHTEHGESLKSRILKVVFGGLGSKLLADFGFSKAVLETPPPPMKSGG
jgi:hypothetical protein